MRTRASLDESAPDSPLAPLGKQPLSIVPKGELLIAQAQDIPPDVIWPERDFDEKGEPIFRMMRNTKKRNLSLT